MRKGGLEETREEDSGYLIDWCGRYWDMEQKYGDGRKEKKMERLEGKYLRWVLGIERRTPRYLVREELQRDKLWSRADRRGYGVRKEIK